MGAVGQEDYVRLFSLYGDGVATAYQDAKPGDAERFTLLFEQVMRLLAKGSSYNLSLPSTFTRTARDYVGGDGGTVSRLGDPDTRMFILSDLYDYLHLSRVRRAG
ncbi:hypothetical protein [Rhodospirillum rubrum]|uniref:Uncharacterized protein n=1 Tax=Rhodospirillum rubrum (strain ATCC 11170 / ATH 1.1.1 / DSM 467 / LMG 4362 / NCIMB 8255 / S1) TaxID=269796 RepID=Q2RQR8_RHORT|nr:hypothetical protein [Rhodospirillum rubrum]ABC23527.1 hypothetical protein Rru_A2730 [Rhodospirillum rubrum ATCC 11170]AEO49266.1 hypothetical protein F11_14020 [Rhodospirillum rubrum F11]MBK1664937.1 hypothetical protein [Rhodospirillum rubrum]MBK1678479.1 hypothetical protein [Rhodospirillum rubrum]MBK5955200.1 hypothetical protein [Rhodospirillum rubrum]